MGARGNSRLPGRPRAERAFLLAALWVPLALAGCASRTLQQKLSDAGLQLVDEAAARVPAAERGLYVPCRVLPGRAKAALEPHPDGYLIVGFDRRRSTSTSEIVQALEHWREDEPLRLWVRRNPYGGTSTEWWEGDVVLPGRSTGR
jgi:hypothetical protein